MHTQLRSAAQVALDAHALGAHTLCSTPTALDLACRNSSSRLSPTRAAQPEPTPAADLSTGIGTACCGACATSVAEDALECLLSSSVGAFCAAWAQSQRHRGLRVALYMGSFSRRLPYAVWPGRAVARACFATMRCCFFAALGFAALRPAVSLSFKVLLAFFDTALPLRGPCLGPRSVAFAFGMLCRSLRTGSSCVVLTLVCLRQLVCKEASCNATRCSLNRNQGQFYFLGSGVNLRFSFTVLLPLTVNSP